MKLYRKVFFVILVLLPVLPVLFYLTVYFSSDSARFLHLGSVAFLETPEGLVLQCEVSTWAYELLYPLFGTEPLTGVFESLAKLCNWIHFNVGIPVSVPLVFAVYYFVSEFFLWVLQFIFDLISFVPRKCLEVFR